MVSSLNDQLLAISVREDLVQGELNVSTLSDVLHKLSHVVVVGIHLLEQQVEALDDLEVLLLEGLVKLKQFSRVTDHLVVSVCVLHVLKTEHDTEILLLFRIAQPHLLHVHRASISRQKHFSPLWLSLLRLARRLLKEEHIWDMVRESHHLSDDGSSVRHELHSCLVAV